MGTLSKLYPGYQAQTARMHNTLGKALVAARKKRGLKQNDVRLGLLDYQIDVSTATVSKWEVGETIPNAYQLFALCHVLRIRDGLTAFTGHIDDPELNADGQRVLEEFRNYLVSSGRYAVQHVSASRKNMKIYQLPVSAGTGDWLDSDDYETLSFPRHAVPDGADFGVYVDGSSMEPSYHDGQIAWVRQVCSLEEGDIGVFLYDGCAYIKEYHERMPEDTEDFLDSSGVLHPQIIFHSLNPAYADIPIENDSYYLFGKVLN
ncbi:MAG: LexA family transcriptional regulator [Clostridia bacterium]|nr:LexA family transcriptional regulator [Clostridia bacterium]